MKALPWYLLAILALIIAFLLWRDSRRSAKLESAQSALTEKSDSIRYFVSESGKTVSEKSAADITRDDLEEHYPDIVAELKDLKIELKNVRAVLRANIEAQGSGVVTIIRDTIRVSGTAPVIQDSVNINDGYLSMAGWINGRQFRYQYAYQDSIIFSISGKKKWLFGKESLIGSARMSNPNATVLNQNAILIKEARDKRFVISVGVGYAPFSNQFSPSIHAGYALVKF